MLHSWLKHPAQAIFKLVSNYFKVKDHENRFLCRYEKQTLNQDNWHFATPVLYSLCCPVSTQPVYLFLLLLRLPMNTIQLAEVWQEELQPTVRAMPACAQDTSAASLARKEPQRCKLKRVPKTSKGNGQQWMLHHTHTHTHLYCYPCWPN